MLIERCARGIHYYDKDVFGKCPFCEEKKIGSAAEEECRKTEEPRWTPGVEKHRKENGNRVIYNRHTNHKADHENTETLYYWQSGKTSGRNESPPAFEPVVGWLVCIRGAVPGKSFELHAGKNYMGRGAGVRAQNIDLPDPHVSREHHGVVIYDPKNGVFLVNGGDSRGLLYLNDKLVTAAETLNAYDKLLLGDTELLFVPFCGEKFSWKVEE